MAAEADRGSRRSQPQSAMRAATLHTSHAPSTQCTCQSHVLLHAAHLSRTLNTMNALASRMSCFTLHTSHAPSTQCTCQSHVLLHAAHSPRTLNTMHLPVACPDSRCTLPTHPQRHALADLHHHALADLHVLLHALEADVLGAEHVEQVGAAAGKAHLAVSCLRLSAAAPCTGLAGPASIVYSWATGERVWLGEGRCARLGVWLGLLLASKVEQDRAQRSAVLQNGANSQQLQKQK
eukprot:366239-Chlamydomonas_euryale.AAC.36